MTERNLIKIRGLVQGVGFRPFVYRTAVKLGISGTVLNGSMGVVIDAEGSSDSMKAFRKALRKNAPSRSRIDSLVSEERKPTGYADFRIILEKRASEKEISVSPDLGLCGACLEEMENPGDRRYEYPFIACDDCGPRYTVLESLPYERDRTTMSDFPLCPDCRKEYNDPEDRRFNVESISCPRCGPEIFLAGGGGERIAGPGEAVRLASLALKDGKILAVKGLGGFHLACDALNEEAVNTLRERKHRPSKPLAVMFPGTGSARRYIGMDGETEGLLRSPLSPIVLAEKTEDSPLERSCAPDNAYLGVMIPYTPIHYLLLKAFGGPLVMTSGNVTDEPLAKDNGEALERLGRLADLFLLHNRRIERRMDDGIVSRFEGNTVHIRRARGSVPSPFIRETEVSENILAVGPELKNNIAVSIGDRVVVSNHIGDLNNDRAYDFFTRTIADFFIFYDFRPDTVVSDLHPQYLSTRYAEKLSRRLNIPHRQVQHHKAHFYGTLAEHDFKGEALGVIFDGLGYGEDGNIWGGEFFTGTIRDCKRIGQIEYFPLIGGDTAVRDIKRLVYGILGADTLGYFRLAETFSAKEIELFDGMLRENVNVFPTSSVGRLFDAAAYIAGFRKKVTYEAEAAVYLESLCRGRSDDVYACELEIGKDRFEFKARSIIAAMAEDTESGVEKESAALRFHNTLADMILEAARIGGMETVVLGGGVFQNHYLFTRALRRLQAEGFNVLFHREIPPNDGGIAFGQVIHGRTRHEG